jgi:hypothetical protein
MTSPAEPGASPSTSRRIPDFFIAGQPKSGTTALYEMLKRHPQIYMSRVKEPYYFAVDNPKPEGSGRRWTSLDQTGTRSETLEEYLSLFAEARSDQRAGEATTSYLWSPTAATRIAALQPAARIIAVLREPASFLRSLHLQLLQNRHETEKDFRTALSLDDARREGRHIPDRSVWPMALIYSDRVRYVEQLRRYHEVFPPEQILVLIYDDFRTDNERTVRRVLRFLEVEDKAPIEVMDANPTVSVRSARLDDMTRAIVAGRGPVWGALKAGLKALTPTQQRRNVRKRVAETRRRVAFAAPPPTDEQFMRELRHRLRGEVLALGEYLDRDLVGLWGYDSIE